MALGLCMFGCGGIRADQHAYFFFYFLSSSFLFIILFTFFIYSFIHAFFFFLLILLIFFLSYLQAIEDADKFRVPDMWVLVVVHDVVPSKRRLIYSIIRSKIRFGLQYEDLLKSAIDDNPSVSLYMLNVGIFAHLELSLRNW